MTKIEISKVGEFIGVANKGDHSLVVKTFRPIGENRSQIPLDLITVKPGGKQNICLPRAFAITIEDETDTDHRFKQDDHEDFEQAICPCCGEIETIGPDGWCQPCSYGEKDDCKTCERKAEEARRNAK